MKAKLVRGFFKNDCGIGVVPKLSFGASELHGHDFYELDIILGGKNRGSLNREALDIRRGDVFFLTPEDFHDYSAEGRLDILNLSFTEDFISKEILLSLVSS
ncbi:MAG: AraC family ligand binding domain-containing protein, partial [Clostridia bacterium]|nr:AraC family ligand binding domain-containing protein [Clostridia bacterium]